MVSKTGQKNSFNASSERPLAKLSENQKIIIIGPTELKLWLVKDTLFNVTSTRRSPSFCFILKVLELALYNGGPNSFKL